MIVTEGAVDVSVPFYFVDDVGGTNPGEPTTGLLFSDIETGGSASYQRQGAARVDFELFTLGSAAAGHTPGGFILVDDTEMPGVYRCDIPDAAVAAGVDFVIIYLRAAGANNTITRPIKIDLISMDIRGDSSGLPSTQSQVSNIGSGATGGTHVEATYDNTTQDTIDNAAAVDKGGGLVGIPVTGHAFVAGREVTIAGTTNYNGAFEVISQTANEVVITDTYNAETFGGSETIVSSIKGQVFVGTITSGTFADVSAEQGDLHSMDDDGDNIDIVYGFNVGGSRQATLVAIFANVNGNTDEMAIDAYDFVGDAFVAKKLLPGSGGSSFLELDPELISNNTGTGTEIGDVFVRFRNNATTPSSLDVDKCLLTAVGTNLLIGYPNGFEISSAGTSGTEFGVNGTAGNPCPFADALTMNAAAPLNLFTIQNGETVALAGNSDGLSLTGEAWTLDLSDESIVNMHVRGATVSGASTGSGSDFHDCEMGTCTIAPCSIVDCRFTSKASGGFTMQTAGTYVFHGCGSAVAGNDAPVFTFPGAGDTFISDRAGSGGRQYEGMSAGDLATVEGWGQFIEGTCSGGAVTIRGCLTTSGISNITITDKARFSVDQITGGEYPLSTDVNGRIRIVDGTGAGELDTNLGGVILTSTERAATVDAIWDEVLSTSAHNTAQTSGERLRQLTSMIIANNTAEVGNSPAINQIQLASGESAVDGTFDPGIVALIGGIGSGQSRLILEYEGSTKLATLNRDWKVAPDATTEYIILGSDGGLHVNEGLAQGGGASSITLNSLASSTNDLYNGQFVFLVSGPGQDQVGRVTAYNGTSKVATIMTTSDGWAIEPTDATGYIMVPILDVVPTLLGSPAGASVSVDIAAVKTDTGNLITRIPSALFAGMTSLAQWLGLIAGKQVGNTTARNEVRATGAGSGTFDETTDSEEATVDRGNVAWITGAGGDATEANQNAMIATLATVALTGADSDTLKSLSDQIDGIVGGTGTGARAVAVTVNDGAAVLENAIVRFTEGANTYAGPTNASGQISFSLDDATYDVAVSKPGYTFTPTTLVVDGDKTPTYSMTAVSITAPPNAATTTGVMTVYDEEGSVESGVTVTVQILAGPGTDGIGYDSTEWAETSSALGVVEFAGIILGARYQIWRGTAKAAVETFTAPTSGTSFDLAEVIGRG
jgi:hypothetical protein